VPGRVAIVTGGTGALGQAVVLRLMRDGARVAVPYAVQAEREALVARLAPPDRGRLMTEPVDVIDLAAMTTFTDRVAADWGGVHALVAAVGGFAGGDLQHTDQALWDGMLRLNLTSAFSAARAALPHLLRSGSGRIVLVASRAVLPPAAGFVAYTVAKAGVVALARAVAEETRGRGTTVNAVAPSTMDTPANRAAMPDADPSGWVPVESVADVIALLASESAGHVTGAVLTI
jgi:NAD(P)-dependent dehydrogenase (short-subunit alcohol dehydrogenase family)